MDVDDGEEWADVVEEEEGEEVEEEERRGGAPRLNPAALFDAGGGEAAGPGGGGTKSRRELMREIYVQKLRYPKVDFDVNNNIEKALGEYSLSELQNIRDNLELAVKYGTQPTGLELSFLRTVSTGCHYLFRSVDGALLHERLSNDRDFLLDLRDTLPAWVNGIGAPLRLAAAFAGHAIESSGNGSCRAPAPLPSADQRAGGQWEDHPAS